MTLYWAIPKSHLPEKLILQNFELHLPHAFYGECKEYLAIFDSSCFHNDISVNHEPKADSRHLVRAFQLLALPNIIYVPRFAVYIHPVM